MSLRNLPTFLLLPALSCAAAAAQTSATPQLQPHPATPPSVTATGAAAEAIPAKPDAILDLLRRTNGLDLSGAKPWHLLAHYEVFDAEGKSVEKGAFEETYAGPKNFKRSYESDKTHQVDFGTEQGLFRSGDLPWPSYGAQGVQLLLTDPLTFGPEAKGHSLTRGEHAFGGSKFDCVLIRPKEASEIPTTIPMASAEAVFAATPVQAYAQYCTEPGRPVLRYSSGDRGASAVSYNELVLFQDRYIAKSLLVVNASLKRLTVHIDALEPIDAGALTSLAPPVGVDGPLPSHVTLVTSAFPRAKIQDMPETPASVKDKGIRAGQVFVNLTLSQDGHVTRVEPLFGPSALYPTAIAAAMKWRFQPVTVKGKPAEAEMRSVVAVGMGRPG